MLNKVGYSIALFFLPLALKANGFAATDYFLKANIKYEFDDNVYKRDLDEVANSQNKQGSTIFSKSAHLDVKGSWSKIKFLSNILMEETDYIEQPELNNQTYNVNLALDYLYSKRLSLMSSYDNSRSVRNLTDLDTVQKSEVDNKSFNISILYYLNHAIDLNSNLVFSESRNIEESFSNLDSKKKSYQLGADLKATTKLVISLFHKRTYSNSVDSSNNLLNFSENNTGIVLKYNYSPKTLLVFEISQTNFLNNDYFNYSVDITYNMSPKSIFSLSSYKRFDNSLQISSLKSENGGIAFRYNYLYSSKINASINAEKSTVNSDGSLSEFVTSYNDDLLNLSFTTEYIFNKNLTFTFGYTHQTRRSSRNGFDFESNIFHFDSNYKF